MLTSKERAQLRSEAQSCDTIFFIGKLGVSDEIIEQLERAINARELIKLGVQESCEYTAREAADIIAPRLEADVVAVIGRKFVLWRKSRKSKPEPVKKPAQSTAPMRAKGGENRSKGGIPRARDGMPRGKGGAPRKGAPVMKSTAKKRVTRRG